MGAQSQEAASAGLIRVHGGMHEQGLNCPQSLQTHDGKNMLQHQKCDKHRQTPFEKYEQRTDGKHSEPRVEWVPLQVGGTFCRQVLGFAFGLLKHFFKSAWPWEMKSFGFWSLWHSHQRQQTVALPLHGRFQIQQPKSILVLCFRSLAAREVGKGWHMMAWWEGYEDSMKTLMKTLWHGPNSHFEVHRGTGCCQTHRKPAGPPSQPWIHEL